MSQSLAGGLVPLGKRGGSGSAGSSSLSGGLIPLGNSKPKLGAGSNKPTFESRDFDDVSPDRRPDEANRRDKEEEEGEDGEEERRGGASRGEKKSKRASSNTRHGGSGRKRDKAKDTHRRGRLKPAINSPIVEGGSEGEEEKSRPSYLLPESDGDDEYLFMGATAGTKGRRSSGGAAEAAALLLNSDDSFGLPKTSKGSPEIGTTPKKNMSPSYPYSEHSQKTSSADFSLQGVDHEGDKLERQGTAYASSAVAGRRRGRTSSRDQEIDVNSTTAAGGNPLEGPGFGKADTGIDFDSPDEADDLLRLTDPVALSAPTTPAKRPDVVAAISWRGRTRTGRLDPTVADNGNQGSGPAFTSRRRSPSPPSSPRRDRSKDQSQSPDVSPRRFLPGRGASQTGSVVGAAYDEKLGGVAAVELKEAGMLGRTDSAARATGGSGDIVGEATGPVQARPGVSGGTDSAMASLSRGSGTGMNPSENVEGGAKGAGIVESIGSGDTKSERTTRERGQSEDNDPPSRSSATEPATSSGVPRRSALTRADMTRSREPRSRGVTFDDDLGGIDALDILPSSDDDEKTASPAPPLDPVVPTASFIAPSPSFVDGHGVLSTEKAEEATGATSTPGRSSRRGGDSGGQSTSFSLSAAAASARADKRRSTSMTAGLSPEAALLMAEDSSGEENPSSASALISHLALGIGPESHVGAAASNGVEQRPHDGELADSSASVGGDIVADAKLDLALGFMPSAMEGGRKPRRALPSGGRRRRRLGESQTAGISHATSSMTTVIHGPTAVVPKFVAALTAASPPEYSTTFAADRKGVEVGKDADAELDGTARKDRNPSSSTFPVVGENRAALSTEASAFKELPLPARSNALGVLPGMTSPLSSDVTPSVETGGSDGGVLGAQRRIGSDSAVSNVSKQITAGLGGVDPSIIASLERQLVLLSGDREAAVARCSRDEQRLQREVDGARGLSVAAETRASQLDADLAAARARIRQLEAEAGEHASRLAGLESRSLSDLRAEQESCFAKISEADARNQNGIRKAEARHNEALSELKRVHREELEDIKRRNADSKSLEALAGQVQASAGAMKLLQAELVERKGASEVSREGQMEARERLIKELEGSARRAQQTAEDEVQRLQGTLMAMDQVMRALRGQNAGERERLRQEHLRMEALQGSMVAEVEAVRQSVDEERKRLAERCAALDRDKRAANKAAREEMERLTEQRFKLETERESFAALQLSASQAAEQMGRRQADEDERIALARQSLDREASSLEARLSAAREDLQKADDVGATLSRLRDHDDLERRRLKTVAGELERAFEEVRTRAAETEESRLRADKARTEALEASEAAKKEKGTLQLRSAQVEESARRQDAERTSIAQARAQSATELSTSRRLKAELARTFAAQQRRAAGTFDVCPPTPIVSHASLVRHGLRDAGVGIGVGLDRRGFSGEGGATVSTASREATTGIRGGAVNCTATPGGPREDSAYQPLSAKIAGVPFTGIMAAEATLQAVAKAPPSLGLDLGRELGRLARRAADMRECTREQSAFLSSKRAASFSNSFPVFPEYTSGTAVVVENPASPDLQWFPASGSSHGPCGVEALGLGCGGSSGTRFDVGRGSGCGISSTVMEELEAIEDACVKRSSALQEEAKFVETLGRLDSPLGV